VFSLVIGNGYRIIDTTRKMPELLMPKVDEGEKAPEPPRPLPAPSTTSATSCARSATTRS